MISNAIERARLLIEQNRFKDAEKELILALRADPDNSESLSLMSICKSQEKKFGEAENLIKAAISHEPGNPYLIYIYAKILFDQDKHADAEKQIREAIQIEPHNDDFFGLLAAIYLDKKDWESALKYANEGLQVSPESLVCLNIRSTALIKLNRKEESYQTIADALNYDPYNANTHANLGWSLLETGQHKKALEHFKEALKIDPTSNNAKAGLIEALKARYLIYRIFLKYAFWIGNMSETGRWGVMIGFYLGFRFVRKIADASPAIKPFLMPVIFLYIAFAISTWIIGPLTDLFLRFNVYGRYALSRKEIMTSNFVGSALLVGLLGFISYLFLQEEALFMAGVFGISMMVPLSSMLTPEKRNSKILLIAYTIGLVGIAGAGFMLYLAGNPSFETASMAYMLGIVLFQWVANAVMSK